MKLLSYFICVDDINLFKAPRLRGESEREREEGSGGGREGGRICWTWKGISMMEQSAEHGPG